MFVLNKGLLYSKLYDWYECYHRILPWRETVDPYKIWVSEIILQQTRVTQGLVYYMRFVSRFPDVQSLAAGEEDEVLLYWQGLGYYSRARNMHKAAQQVVRSCGVVGGVSSEPEDIFRTLRSMPGVGEYTAGAIASFAFDLPYPAMDGNVYRVLARLYDCDIAFDTSQGKKVFHRLAEELMDRAHPRLFNSAIMEFGALHCVPHSPRCEDCPIQAFCHAYSHHTVSVLPVRKPRPILRDRYLNYTIFLTPNGQTMLHQRTMADIWKHLYEFPLVESDHLFEVQGRSVDITHVLSHQRLHARFHIELVDRLPVTEGMLVTRWDAIDGYALSRLTLKALEKIGIADTL